MRRLATIAAFLGATAALAQGVPKEAPPPPGPPKNFSLPAIRRFDLPNGMKVRLMQYGNTLKATIRLVTQTGNIDESVDHVWLANVTGEMMQQGTATRSAEEIARQAALMGGTLKLNVGMNETTIETDVLTESASSAIGLIADVARNPRFPESELARIKTDALRKLSVQSSEPQSRTIESLRRVFYPNEPYGRSFPTPEMLQGYTLDQIRQFHDRNFGAVRSRIYVVGRFDEAAVERAIRRDFAGWKAGAPPAAPVVSPAIRPAVYLMDRPGAVQSTMLIAIPLIGAAPGSADYRPLNVANAILGGTFMSRITSILREQKGYSYSPISYLEVMPGTGYWAEDADVTTNVTGESIKEVIAEIKRLRAEPPSAEELHGIQNFLAGIFVLFNSSRDSITWQLSSLDLYGLGDDYLRDYVKSIYAVTPADVQRVMQKYIDPARLAIVVVGDKKAIAEQLKPFGTIIE